MYIHHKEVLSALSSVLVLILLLKVLWQIKKNCCFYGQQKPPSVYK